MCTLFAVQWFYQNLSTENKCETGPKTGQFEALKTKTMNDSC
ncbi:hypothetical protein GBF38_022375, partial [Nibea albiflora]